MKIKLDENMPARLAQRLFAAGHDTDTVQHEGLSGQPDDNVWQAVQNAGRFLITQDFDFSDLRKYQPGSTMGYCLFAWPIQADAPSLNELARFSPPKMWKAGWDVLSSLQNGRSGCGDHDG